MTEVVPEQWVPVISFNRFYEGFYEVSSLARVRSVDRVTSRGHHLKGRILAQCLNDKGYYAVTLSRDARIKVVPVHVLVLESFKGVRVKGGETRHGDGNALNNLPENLKHGDHVANIQDQIDHGRHAKSNVTHCPQNHEYTEQNTIWTNGYRQCKACHAEIMKRQREEGEKPDSEIAVCKGCGDDFPRGTGRGQRHQKYCKKECRLRCQHERARERTREREKAIQGYP